MTIKRITLCSVAIILGGLLAGCGTASPSNNVTNGVNGTNSTNAAVNQTNTVVANSVDSTSKPKVAKTAVKTKKKSTQKAATSTTVKKPTAAHTVSKSSSTTTKPKTTSTSTSTSTRASTSTGSTSSTTNTSSPSPSTGSSTTSNTSSTPTPPPSSVVMQNVTLPITGSYPSGCQTAKMVYDKATGIMEGYFKGLNDSGNDAWLIQPATGTLYYSNNGGDSWLGTSGNQYSNMPQMQGVSYTPNLVVKANTTIFYVGMAPANQYGNANGQFTIKYSNGSFSVTAQ